MSKILLLFKNKITALVLLGAVLLLPYHGYSQSDMITGTVSSEDGERLPGVSVIIKGTTNGTTTDMDGAFQLKASSNDILVFSFIGMRSREIEVGAQTNLKVVLIEDIAQLDEVVVVGYGTQKRSELTGSVVSVEGDALKKVPVATVAESLTGRLAGVQVTSSEGSPDNEVRIRVRGGASLTQDNSPLYIVDGFPVNSISDLTPSDIASIDVLKDASSTAIYGSRGANGVVIITTKSGKQGKVTVSYNSFYAVNKIANKLDVLSPGDYARWQYEYAMLKDSEDISSYEDYFGLFQDIDLYDGLPANDWQQQVYGRTGHVFSNDLSVRGGSEKFNYSANIARYDQKAIMVGSDYLRNNLTLKLNNKPHKDVNLNFSVRYSDTDISGGGANEQNEVSSADSRLKHSIGYSPIPIDGLTSSNVTNTNEQTAGDLTNPLTSVADNNRIQTRKNYNLAGGVSWKIADFLTLKSDFGLDNYYYNDNRFYGLTTYYVNNKPSAEQQGQPAASLSDRRDVRYRTTNTLSTENLLKGENKLTLLVGQEYLLTQRTQNTNVIHGYPKQFTSEEAFKLTTQGTPFTIDNYLNPDDKLLSFFGRFNYQYKDRYLLEGVYRADASSRFSGDNFWGYFPSISAGWKISEENFMRGVSSWVNLLKLRASYGIAGNNNIQLGQTVQSYVSNNTSWLNNIDTYWAPQSRLANPDLKWETTATKNIGLDFGILKGRINGSVEVYLNNTDGVLIDFPIPGTGYESQFRNMGETQNKGLELALSAIAIDKEDYGFSVNFNVAFNRNEVKSLGLMEEFGQPTNWASTQINNDYLITTGQPVGIMYGYRNDGRYEVSDFNYDASTGEYTLKDGIPDVDFLSVVPGMMKLKDLDGDGTVTVADQEIIGNANPKHTGGIVLNGYAYGFDLTAAFNWSYGNNIYNANKIEFTTANQNNQYRNLIDMQAEGKRWTNIDWETGELVTDPQQLAAMNANTTMWSPYMDRYVFSDWAVEDGSFLRLNTLTLGYTLPASLTSKAHIEKLRFYVTGYNVFVLTNYSGFDPEVSTRRKTALTPGVDYSAYPRSRQISVGLNLTF
ncbi:SusC/RagA family TonB-linked outer membrane protein [Fulvivirga ligni]|uniref:SusC/RagA family TonB-linked outer membrane protein n=1 Tax=Fulvivirga ligni TaxID=2904246 RepID=UPI001F2B1D29|nr:TonB-dependent receptor [Fulvivirga ligni]UII23405.1 TonB-dependent receptor [Fulvivirga ligni]